MASLADTALKQRHISLLKSTDDHTPHRHYHSNADFDDKHHHIEHDLNKKHLGRYKSGLHALYSNLNQHHPRLSAWLLYLAFLFTLAFVAFQVHYALPTPVSSEEGAIIDPVTGQYRFSEENVRRVVRHLSEDIGYRIVGTEQDLETQAYLVRELTVLREQAQRESTKRSGAETEMQLPKFDMWVQVADGSHQFDFMSKVVMKMYTNMTNIIVRLSCGPECDQSAILLNAHYDTTLGSPGAVDDALPIGVMMELIRILSQRPALRKNSLIFLFNGGEESLQDASHSFITTHELRNTIRAVINLEGCGTTGPEILFQANSRAMIDAYRKVPYPHGTVMGNDLFTTGIVLSDTDFRQFVDYGNLTGLDMAVYKNSYLYHTHLDLDGYMEQGLPQHLGENTLALATYLADEVDLAEGLEHTKAVVYFDVLGQFFVSYSMEAAVWSHAVVGALVVFTLVIGASRPTVRSITSVLLSFAAALLSPVLSAFVIQALGKSMVWFSHEWLPVIMFGPLGAAGMLSIQLAFHSKESSRGANELSTLSGVQVVYTVVMGLASLLRIASSYFLAMYSLFTSVALLFNYKRTMAQRRERGSGIGGMDYATYFVASAIQTLYLSHLGFSLFDLIVPLTGRIGVDAPVDHIIAIMTGFGVFSFNPALLAFSHRFGRASLRRIVSGLLIFQLAILLVAAVLMSPYDVLHPKRIFVQHLRNMSSGESLMYVAHADPGPFYTPYISQIESLFETKSTFKSGSDNPGDWNAIYPFNQFLDSYVFDTAPYIRKHTTNSTLTNSDVPLTELIQAPPKLIAENVSYNPETGLRKLTILCTHPNYIWTVTTFDADVVSWSMQLEVPSKKRFRYVIRNAGGYLTDGWRLDLEYRASGPDDRLRVELTAMETEGFGKDVERELQGSGDVGVMRKLVKARPADVSLTYFSAVLSNFEL
ncbi:hypothetical protein BC939DRAFT_401367 [Gamsiella multidivaricata]|uniref:uncharacterized protein n=1 Tax=Gamsiella multidivaricata TaxID=101098 RepID=UPI00221F6CC3|nr:uncharacterized protein BC939DRAFT_401367 [Gamsiella multidivaricata]KAI7818545.1 hypothetical protein BC939DRAFT_401367 [Gamsiella multidivaricata]